MFMTTILGFVQMYLPLGMYTPVKREGKPPNFFRNMVLVGTTRSVSLLSWGSYCSSYTWVL